MKLKAQFPNDEGKLFPNQFVNVRMVVDVRKDVVVVPVGRRCSAAPQGTVVYVVKDDSTVALRPVTTGPDRGPAHRDRDRGCRPASASSPTASTASARARRSR